MDSCWNMLFIDCDSSSSLAPATCENDRLAGTSIVVLSEPAATDRELLDVAGELLG